MLRAKRVIGICRAQREWVERAAFGQKRSCEFRFPASTTVTMKGRCALLLLLERWARG